MWWVGKLLVLLLFSSAFLYTYGAAVLRTKDLHEINSLLSSIDDQLAEECDCGAYGLCEFVGSRKKCTCAPKTAELDGKCIECDCGTITSACAYNLNRNKVCYCSVGEIDVNGQCKECNCGLHGLCRLEFGRKKCFCAPNFIESDGKCVPSLANTTSTSVNTESSSLMTTILTSTVTSCDCGFGGSCHLDSSGEKICNCFSGYAPNNGHCYECYCGAYGLCEFVGSSKKCTCAPKTAELDGTCIKCDCGTITSSCSYNLKRNKVCYCSVGEIDVNGQCKECDCGLHGLCRLEFGRKKCFCAPNFIESDGKCVPSLANTTTTSVNTESSSLMTTILTSTVTSCDCGFGGTCHLDSSGEKICNCFSGYAPNKGHCYKCDCGSYGICNLETGLKRCICDVNYAEKNGKCEYCSCGENSKSCSYNVLGEKECNCSSAYAQNRGYCEECNCGPYGSCSFEYDRKICKCKSFAVEKNGVCVDCNCGNYSKSCSYNWIGDKICYCFPGYVGNNGNCEAICNEDKCTHGKCEIVGNGFTCRCNEGFTGQRCEEKVQTKLSKQNLWMVLLLSVVFAIFILLSFKFCFWTLILNKISKK